MSGTRDEIAARMTMAELIAVAIERQRQTEKWGTQRHTWVEWMTVLGEEYGEACKAAVELNWGRSDDIAELRRELIQVAAVAVQIAERISEHLYQITFGRGPA